MGLHLRCLNKKYFASMALAFFFLSSVCGAAIKFDKTKIKLGNKTLVVEVARTSVQHEAGLMFRTKMADDEGMLFIFNNEETRFFWMKNTLLDLSIGYFDGQGVLIDIQEMRSGKGIADDKLPSYPSAKPAKYALEMNKAWFEKNKISLGSRLQLK